MKNKRRIPALVSLVVCLLSCSYERAPAADGAPKIDHVIILGVDGGGAFFREADTPNLDRIFKAGALSYEVITSKPTISAQCWGSMLLGVVPEIHGLTNSIVSSNPYPVDSEFPSVFRVIRENNPDAKLASFCNWNPINIGIIEDNLDVVKGTAGNDSAVADLVCDYLEENAPTLLFVQFDECDYAGHSKGYGTEGHLQQLNLTDGYIQRIYQTCEKRGILDSTLLIVTRRSRRIWHEPWRVDRRGKESHVRSSRTGRFPRHNRRNGYSRHFIHSPLCAWSWRQTTRILDFSRAFRAFRGRNGGRAPCLHD